MTTCSQHPIVHRHRHRWGIFDNDLMWLNQLLKPATQAELELAGESWHFDWLSSAQLSESNPQLGSAQLTTGPAQAWLSSGSSPAYQASQH